VTMMALTRAMVERTKEDNNEANTMLAGGATIAAIGIAGAIAGGAVCPVCVVAAPLLLGIGVARKIRAAKRKARAEDAAPLNEATGASILPDKRLP
jgi:hypothetical protein